MAYGVRANISAKRGSLCQSDLTEYNFNNVYVMIAEMYDTTDYQTGWVQSGYERHPNETTHHFAQEWDGNSHPSWGVTTKYSVGSLNRDSYYEYIVRVSYTCTTTSTGKCFRMWADGVLMMSTTWDPDASWFEPWSYQLMAETRYKASDVPGTPTDRVHLENIQLYNSSNSWYSIPCGSLTAHNDNPTRWNSALPGCNFQQIYTL